jgi:hypothetical protein
MMIIIDATATQFVAFVKNCFPLAYNPYHFGWHCSQDSLVIYLDTDSESEEEEDDEDPEQADNEVGEKNDGSNPGEDGKEKMVIHFQILYIFSSMRERMCLNFYRPVRKM